MSLEPRPVCPDVQQAVVLGNRPMEMEPSPLEPACPWPEPAFDADEGLTAQRCWRILKKHCWMLLAVTAAVVTLVGLWTFSTTPLYEANGRIAIYPENSDALGLKELDVPSADSQDYQLTLRTQVSILGDPALALEVIRNLDLQRNPAFAPKEYAPLLSGSEAAGAPELEADGQATAELLRRFRTSLSVEEVRATQLVDVRFLSPDPELAARVVNELTKVFVEHNFRAKYKATTQTSEWLAEQLAEIQVRMEASQERLVRYQREAGILGTDEKQNIVTAKLDALNRELLAAEADRIQKEALYRLSRSASPELVASLAPESPLPRLREQQVRLKTELAQLAVKLGPSFPRVLEAQNQLKTVEGELQAEVAKVGVRLENDFRAAQQREQMLRRSFEAQKQEANRLNESAIQYSILKRDAEANRELYEGLLTRLKQAGVTAGLRSNNVRVVRAAVAPARPAQPNVPVNLAFGLAGGLLAGMLLAAVVEMLDNTVSTPQEAQILSVLPPLGVIPLARTNGANGRKGLKPPPGSESTALVAHHQPLSEVAESYRALRTSLLFSLPVQPKVILFTSPLPQEGKTTSSVNTAIVLAQRGERVLLVDADLRRAGLTGALGVNGASGLSRILAEKETWQQVLRPSPVVPNLWVLPAGAPPSRASEMLGSPLMHALIACWRKEFDRVILDSPPLLPVTDAVLLSLLADAVVLVARPGKTTKTALRRCRELLAQVDAQVIGVLVNGLDSRSPDYYDYYGAKYQRYYSEAAG